MSQNIPKKIENPDVKMILHTKNIVRLAFRDLLWSSNNQAQYNLAKNIFGDIIFHWNSKPLPIQPSGDPFCDEKLFLFSLVNVQTFFIFMIFHYPPWWNAFKFLFFTIKLLLLNPFHKIVKKLFHKLSLCSKSPLIFPFIHINRYSCVYSKQNKSITKKNNKNH